MSSRMTTGSAPWFASIAGKEGNVFWRRAKGDASCPIERASTQTLIAGDVLPLGKDNSHSLTNQHDGLPGALHLDGSRFFTLEHGGWCPDQRNRAFL